MKLINIANEFRTLYLFTRDDKGKLGIKTVNSFFPYYYVPDPEGTALSFKGEPLRKVIVSAPHEIAQNRTDDSYEADILFSKRYLIDKIDTLEKTKIKYCFIDIEVLTEEKPDTVLALQPISCITIYNSFSKEIKTFFLGNYKDDRELIEDFIIYMKAEAFDLWLSWYVDFDYDYLYHRYNKLTNESFPDAISPVGKNRYGKRDIFYPIGTSIVDYLGWFKMITMNKEVQYTLDAIAQKHLGKGKVHSKVDFSKLTDEIKERNIEDVTIMKELEEKKNLIPYFDEIRRLSKVEWEDLIFNCLDEKSEILTKKGWKNINTIQDTDLVLSLNVFNEEYEYIPIDKIFKEDYNGEMIEYKKGRIDFLVTPHHKFPMKFKRNSGLYKNTNELVFEKAKSIPKQRRLFILGSKGYKNGNIKYFKDDEIKLSAWIITEGSFAHKGITRINSGEIIIYQSSSVHKNYYDEIKNILNNLKLKYNQHKNRFMIKSFSTLKYRLLLKEQKRIPEIFYELPLNQMRLFLLTCIKGDGYKNIGNNSYISTADKILAEQYQRLAILCGYNAYIMENKKEYYDKEKTIKFKNIKTVYYVYIYLKENYTVEHNTKWRKKINYKGQVWCIANRNQNFVMKRNNKVLISGNSRILDMLLLTEAKKQKVVLPMKPDERRGTLAEKPKFEGAYRDILESGAHFEVGTYDISSAYPSMIIDFCLDPANLKSNDNSMGVIPITIKNMDRDENKQLQYNKDHSLKTIEGNTHYYTQDNTKLLSIVTKKLLTLKGKIKNQLKKCKLDSQEYKDTKQSYDAIKTIANSTYGVFGNRFFRLFSEEIAETTTFLVRDFLDYVVTALYKKGYKVIYVDTDGIMIDNHKEDISNLLNDLAIKWAKEKYNKEDISLNFGFEGIFESILLATKCRYKGYLKTSKGVEPITKGLEIKRKDSTIYMKNFQEILIDKIIKHRESKEKILIWVKKEINNFKNQPLQDISCPCKLGMKPEEYKNVPILLRALQNTKGFMKKVGDPFYYIYVIPSEEPKITTVIKDKGETGFDNIVLEKNLTRKEGIQYARKEWKIDSYPAKSISVVHKKEKIKDVLAFDEENNKHITKDIVNWDKMEERNIHNKTKVIYDAMKWEYNV